VCEEVDVPTEPTILRPGRAEDAAKLAVLADQHVVVAERHGRPVGFAALDGDCWTS
jgi:hypothetical protein